MSIFVCKLVLTTIQCRLQRQLDIAEFWKHEAEDYEHQFLAHVEDHFGRYGF